jgi:hypothetical protein
MGIEHTRAPLHASEFKTFRPIDPSACDLRAKSRIPRGNSRQSEAASSVRRMQNGSIHLRVAPCIGGDNQPMPSGGALQHRAWTR